MYLSVIISKSLQDFPRNANISIILKVITCGFPPLEDREKSLKLLAGHDFFGSSVLTKEETVS